MHFSRSLQGSKSAIKIGPVSIEWIFLLFLLIQNFLAKPNRKMIKFVLIFTKTSFFILAGASHLVQTWEKKHTCPKNVNFPNENSFL